MKIAQSIVVLIALIVALTLVTGCMTKNKGSYGGAVGSVEFQADDRQG